MIQNNQTIYTIGHSNHTIEKFVGLLQQHNIEVVVDIRSAPYSRYSPQFNKETLSVVLGNNRIKYLFLGNELGARPQDKNCYINNKVSFEKLKQTNAFQEGIQRVLKGACEYTIALLCSEKDPITCHRVILVARVLAEKGANLQHILEDGNVLDQHQLESQLVKKLHLESTFFAAVEDVIQDAYEIQGGENSLFNAAGGNGRLTMGKEGVGKTIKLFTIGFTQKNAEEFFSILKAAQVKTLIDIRLNNNSQLAAFTKKEDLRYFLKEICGISYKHMLEYAPTDEILDGYKKKMISWEQYESKYIDVMQKREIVTQTKLSDLDGACLLCSEPKADKCHRRLLAEYFKKHFPDIQICHL